MRYTPTYRQILTEAQRVGGAELAFACAGGADGYHTRRQVAQSLGGPCATVYDGEYPYGMPLVDVPDDPTGLLL